MEKKKASVNKGGKGMMPPPGIAFLPSISISSSSIFFFLRRKKNKKGFNQDEDEVLRAKTYRSSVLFLTFLAYALFHASRKPPSVVKNALTSDDDAASLQDSFLLNAFDHHQTDNFTSLARSKPPDIKVPWPLHVIYKVRTETEARLSLTTTYSSVASSSSGWAPFNGSSGTSLLGEVDVAFLAAYSVSMFVAGHVGDRVDLRWFLSGGMVASGACVCLFGFAYWWNVHWLAYFFIVQILGGLVQATGWPAVVAVVGNWFGKSKRGLIMGVWNAHTSVGNICGTLMASSVLAYGWGWSFLVPGMAIIIGGVIMFLFLVVEPEIVGIASPHEPVPGPGPGPVPEPMNDDDLEKEPLLKGGGEQNHHDGSYEPNEENHDRHAAVGFLQALAIPRVAPFAFCLFFAKLVAYTFLYWLPFYIKHTEIAGVYLSNTAAGNLSTVFDIGGTIGGILAGYISDRMNSRAIVAASFIYTALPALLFYRVFGSGSFWLNALLLFIAGVCVNGPYALITTAVAADLGTHESLKGSSKALATVTAIIDGTGSIGAAVGPLLTGYLSELYGWNSVFIMLMISAVLSGLLLTGLVIEEFKESAGNAKARRRGRDDGQLC